MITKISRCLELRVTGSGNGKPSLATKPSTRTSSKRQSSAESQKQTPSSPPKLPARGGYRPPSQDDEYVFFLSNDEPKRSHTPQHISYYPSYPPTPEEIIMAPHGSVHQPYRPMTTEAYPEYFTATASEPINQLSIKYFNNAVEPYSHPKQRYLELVELNSGK
ncbi:hypothetical protein V8F06_014533 [Rhypophila decipiens]